MLRTSVVLAVVGTAAAFAPGAPGLQLRTSAPAVSRAGLSKSLCMAANPMDDMVKDFAKSSPQFASRGFGVTVNAERWNGRHAMFGMVAMVATAYLQGHGLIPDADKVLDIKQWGGLAQVGFGETITNERAIVMIAHVHVLMVSIFAAVAPFRFQDTLAKQIGYTPEAPAGLIPPFKTGLTAEAELINGRLAMLGLIAIVMASIFTGTSVVDTINLGLGKILY